MFKKAKKTADGMALRYIYEALDLSAVEVLGHSAEGKEKLEIYRVRVPPAIYENPADWKISELLSHELGATREFDFMFDE
ncbi:MAG: hypothetical protein WCJ10_07220, partial [Opitutaceae bacterium]